MKIKNCQQLKKLLKGFTLIELLVVLSLIGILASLLIVSLQSSKKSALDGRRKADFEAIRLALEIYKSNCGRYPPSLSFGGSLVSVGPTAETCSVSNYMTLIPKDPKDPVKLYSYISILPYTTYILRAGLETGEFYDVTPLGSRTY